MSMLGFVRKAIKLLLTELVSQCRNILPLAFSALTSLWSVNTEKAAENIFLHLPPTQLIRVYNDSCFKAKKEFNKAKQEFVKFLDNMCSQIIFMNIRKQYKITLHLSEKAFKEY